MNKQEIIDELKSIWGYMDNENAIYGYGQIKSLIDALEMDVSVERLEDMKRGSAEELRRELCRK